MSLIAATGPSAYWYLTRGTGTVALILLTLAVALGVANVRRIRTEHVPRFVLDSVHRNVALLGITFLVLHIVTSMLDGYAPIRLIDVVVPFGSAYRPLWLGFGAVAFDLLLAVTITSLLRRRFGYRRWRAVHWAAYASWPFALLHGLGTGSDTKMGWMLVIVAGCLIVVIVAVVARAIAGWPHNPGPRVAALSASAIVPLGLLVWLPSGPLAAGWARRAGTPASLLGASTSASNSVRPFTARVAGTVRQGSTASGLRTVDIALSWSQDQLSRLTIHLEGEPIDGGGLQMTSSEMTLGTGSDPSAYAGHVTSLQGSHIAAQVTGSGGTALGVVAQLDIDPNTGEVDGTLSVTP